MKLNNINLNKEYINNILNIEYTNYRYSQFRFLYQHLLKNHNKIKGDIIELGVYNGRSLLTIAIILKKLKSKKLIYGFDTFSGFPKTNIKDRLINFKNKNFFEKKHYEEFKLNKKIKKKLINTKISVNNISTSANFGSSNLKTLKKKIKLLKLNNVKLIKGNICKTLPIFFKKNPKFKVFSCNFDVDLYQPYKIALPLIWNKLEKKGYVHLDEYFSLKFPGPRIATNEFIKFKKIKIKRNNTRLNEFKRYYLQK